MALPIFENKYEGPSKTCLLQGEPSEFLTGHGIEVSLAAILLSVFLWKKRHSEGFPRWLSGKRICLPTQESQETLVQSLNREDPLEKGMQPTPVFLPGESHGQERLAGCNPWGHKELDTTEWLNWTSGKGGPRGAPMSLLDTNRQTGSPSVSRSSCDHEGSSEKPSKREKYPVFLRKWSHLHYITFH